MQAAPLKTSETWILLVAAVLETLVHVGVIPKEMAATINVLVAAVAPVLFQTIFRKLRDGKIPFLTPSSTPK
jgi:hypothetical protein